MADIARGVAIAAGVLVPAVSIAATPATGAPPLADLRMRHGWPRRARPTARSPSVMPPSARITRSSRSCCGSGGRFTVAPLSTAPRPARRSRAGSGAQSEPISCTSGCVTRRVFRTLILGETCHTSAPPPTRPSMRKNPHVRPPGPFSVQLPPGATGTTKASGCRRSARDVEPELPPALAVATVAQMDRALVEREVLDADEGPVEIEFAHRPLTFRRDLEDAEHARQAVWSLCPVLIAIRLDGDEGVNLDLREARRVVGRSVSASITRPQGGSA